MVKAVKKPAKTAQSGFSAESKIQYLKIILWAVEMNSYVATRRWTKKSISDLWDSFQELSVWQNSFESTLLELHMYVTDETLSGLDDTAWLQAFKYEIVDLCDNLWKIYKYGEMHACNSEFNKP